MQNREILVIRKLLLFIIWSIHINDKVGLNTAGTAGKQQKYQGKTRELIHLRCTKNGNKKEEQLFL